MSVLRIQPDKHTHPDKTIISSSYILLKLLVKHRTVSFVKMQEAIEAYTQSGAILFIPAISLLFLLGVVTYHPKNDTFEYIGNINETI